MTSDEIKSRTLLAAGIDLNTVSEELDAFQKNAADVWRESCVTKKQLDDVRRQLDEANKTDQQLRSTIRALQELIHSAHKNLSAKCDLQDTVLKLKEEVKAAEFKLQQRENEDTAKTEAFEQKIQELNKLHAAELIKQKENISSKFGVEVSSLLCKINEQKSQIDQLLHRVDDIERDKHAELIKLKLEYDAKLQKLNKQLTLASLPANQLSAANQDIYRKKLHHLKSEYEEQIANLQRTVVELQCKLQSQGRR